MAGTAPTSHLCRLQHSVTLLQQQSEEQRLLLQTLRAELHVYESLPGRSAETRAGMGPMHSIPAQLLLPMGCLAPLTLEWSQTLLLWQQVACSIPAGRQRGRAGPQHPQAWSHNCLQGLRCFLFQAASHLLQCVMLAQTQQLLSSPQCPLAHQWSNGWMVGTRACPHG